MSVYTDYEHLVSAFGQKVYIYSKDVADEIVWKFSHILLAVVMEFLHEHEEEIDSPKELEDQLDKFLKEKFTFADEKDRTSVIEVRHPQRVSNPAYVRILIGLRYTDKNGSQDKMRTYFFDVERLYNTFYIGESSDQLRSKEFKSAWGKRCAPC